MKGLILKGIGGFYYVETQDGAVVECRARGRFRVDNIKPVAGDYVMIGMAGDNTGYILEILERKNVMTRPPIANLDVMFIVASTKAPEPDLMFIDKVIAVCAILDIEPVLVINKTDLKSPGELMDIYCRAVIPVIAMCAEEDDPVAKFSPHIKGNITAFAGMSGVGKSSIINRLCRGANMEVGEVSRLKRGRHTTRHVELIPSYGGYVADTPGFSSFEFDKLWEIERDQLAFGFPEFAPYTDKCRFTGCSHTKEMGCAVISARDQGDIAKSRHESYVFLYDQIKDRRPWDK